MNRIKASLSPLLCFLPRGLLAAALLALAAGAQAASRDFGDYTVHYIAVNSTFLKPEVAERYGIVRGQRRGFLNVSVQKNHPDGGSEAVAASISGGRHNLMQQSSDLEFIEVREGEAIYYLAQFDFSNAEDLRFELQIRPEGKGPSHSLEWATKLYMDR